MCKRRLGRRQISQTLLADSSGSLARAMLQQLQRLPNVLHRQRMQRRFLLPDLWYRLFV